MTRKATLASLLRGSLPGLHFNEHIKGDGEAIYRHACKMGVKRLGSRYTYGRCHDWLKFKNPNAPAVRREAKEDGGTGRWRRAIPFTLASWRSGMLCEGVFPSLDDESFSSRMLAHVASALISSTNTV